VKSPNVVPGYLCVKSGDPVSEHGMTLVKMRIIMNLEFYIVMPDSDQASPNVVPGHLCVKSGDPVSEHGMTLARMLF